MRSAPMSSAVPAISGSLPSTAAQQFRLNRWDDQENYVEVWCEKDALSSVIEPTCRSYHVRFMANRGYSSATAMYDAAQRCVDALERGQNPVIIYLGDHDPSGMDMSRDVEDRLRLLSYDTPIETVRLALNYNQVEQYSPPPNPAKLTDSRATTYIARYGMQSWELDALDPQTLDQLIAGEIERFMDPELYDQRIADEDAIREQLRGIAADLENAP